MKNRIAVLGATSHIAKGLIYNFIKSKGYRLFLFARSPQMVNDFLIKNDLKEGVYSAEFKYFPEKEYDAIINCVGFGTPNKLRDNLASVFSVTEEYDNMAMNHLFKFDKSCYINFSSGAVYGNSFTGAVCDNSAHNIYVNNIMPEQYYGIAKINSEAKHRAHKNLNIVDIRVFSYFSRFIDLDGGYFLTALIKSIQEKKEFMTNSCDFIRDYLHPQDLFNLIQLVIKSKPFNKALDSYSLEPVSKFTLMDYFVKKYGLRYSINEQLNSVSPTGTKNIYCSQVKNAAGLGYNPNFSSIETIAKESELMFNSIHN